MFIETRFPDDPSYGAIGGPNFKTDIAVVDNGFEYRNQNWSIARLRFEVGFNARNETQFDVLLNFYQAMKGKAFAFRYKDWSDYTVNEEQGVFGIIDSTHFQLYKRYEIPPFETSPDYYDRKINKPVSTITVSGGTVSSIDYTTGIVTMASGTPDYWTGEFDVPVRFDTDSMQASILTRSGGRFMYGWTSIVLIEVRL